MAFRKFAELVDAKVRAGVASVTGVKPAPWNELKKSLVEHGRSTREELKKGAQQAPADAARFEEIERDGREQVMEEAGQALDKAETASVDALLGAQTGVIQVVLKVEAKVVDAIESFKADCATSNATESTSAESKSADEAGAPTDSVKVEVTGSVKQETDGSEVSAQLSEAPSEQLPDQPSEQ